jgi:DNA replication protein DnaC
VDEPGLLAQVKLGWSGDKDPLLQVAKQHVLVLDDLGRSIRKGQVVDWIAEALERLIDYRHKHHLATLFTSNVPMAEIGGLLGARCASRLRRCGMPLVLGGADWR